MTQVELHVKPNNPEYLPAHRCPWCMQDVHRLGAECRICEQEQTDQTIDTIHSINNGERIERNPDWTLPYRYWLLQI